MRRRYETAFDLMTPRRSISGILAAYTINRVFDARTGNNHYCSLRRYGRILGAPDSSRALRRRKGAPGIRWRLSVAKRRLPLSPDMERVHREEPTRRVR